MTVSSQPPADHIFGDLDQPENSIAWLNERAQGVRHHQRRSLLKPLPGEAVTLWVTTSADQPVESVHVWLTTDEWRTQTEARFSPQKISWQTACWSYLKIWTVSLPPQSAGTLLRYKIGAKQQGSDAVVFAETQAQTFQDGTHYSIWYAGEPAPDWSDNAIIYQVFVDRFNPGEGNVWSAQGDLRKPFGGTLNGVTEKLSWIKSMGFNTIWLSPIFASPTHHGYDTSDYFQVNPRLGTQDEFIKLLDVAHSHDIKVILDFVANHCSSQHPFFQDAIENPQSYYHDYFVWKNWPAYECFYNVGTMPKLNLAYGSPARDYLIEVAQYWLKLGVDGFRLDYAHGPEHDFWVDFRRASTQANPDHWTFGEIVQPANVQASYADGMGGALDFLLSQAIRKTFAQQEWPLAKFGGFLQDHFDYFPKGFHLPSFIDNHDMNRFLFAANLDERLLRLALMVLYLLPGQPIIYYGTEVPLTQKKSIHAKGAQGFDEARLPMAWSHLDHSNFPDYLANLSRVRQIYPALARTKWAVSTIDEDLGLLVLGKPEGKPVYLCINRSDQHRTVKLPVEKSKGYMDLLTLGTWGRSDGGHDLMLDPYSARLIAIRQD
jgi:glycosidase